MEHRAVQWQVMRDCVSADATKERHRPAIGRRDANGGRSAQAFAQGRSSQRIDQVPAHFAVHARADTGEIGSEAHVGDRHEPPLRGVADVALLPQVRRREADIDDRLLRQLRVPTHGLVRADGLVELALGARSAGGIAGDAELEFPRVGPAIGTRVEHVVDVEHARVRLVAQRWVGERDVGGGMHLLGDRPGRIRLVTGVTDERKEIPEPPPLPDGRLVVIGGQVIRNPRGAESIGVSVVGSGQHIVFDRERDRPSGFRRVRRSRDPGGAQRRNHQQSGHHVAQAPFRAAVHEASMARAPATPSVDSAASRRSPNHAAYRAGTKKIVSTVATVRPPMIAIAIGPQNTLRVSGTMASTVAAAVRTTGRARCTAASTTALQRSRPAAISARIWSTRITALRMIMPDSAMTPRIATKPSGAWHTSNAATTPIRPSGAVRNTIVISEKLWSCSIRISRITTSITGATASNAVFALLLSSTAPPTSTR